MIPEIGHYALVLALFLALVQSVLPLVGAARGNAAWMDVAKPAAIGQFAHDRCSLRGADICPCGVRLLRAERGRRTATPTKPMLYKVAGVWGNHEGSMLLWVLILSLFGGAVAAVRPQPAADAEGARAGGAGA